MTVTEFLSRIPSLELSEWQALYRLRHREARRAELEARARQGLAGRKQAIKRRR